MATTQNITSSYAGKDSGIYISSAIKSADTLDKGVLSVLPNIKYKSVIHKLELANGTVDFACDFTPAGSMDLSEAILEPKKLMVNLELCKENFADTWEAEQMGLSANNEQLPSTFEDYFISRVVAEQGAKIDSDIWNGDANNAGEFDGFLTLWAGDASVVKIATPVAIDATNVIAKLGEVIDAAPDAVIGKEDFQLVVSSNVARAYKRALSNAGYRMEYSAGEKPLDFEGYEMVVLGGLPSDTIAAFQRKNVYFGTALMSDMNEVSILDMKDKDLSDNVRFKMVYQAGVQYVEPSEIVLYKA